MPEFSPYLARIEADWIDYNGHLRDAYYGLVASHAVDDVMDQLGLDAAYRARTACTLYTLEMHLHYLREVRLVDTLSVVSMILDADRKRLQLGCCFLCAGSEHSVATAEVMLLHVRQGEKPASAAFPAELEARLAGFMPPAAARAAWGPGSRKMALTRW